MGAPSGERAAEQACKYHVRRAQGGWLVERAEDHLGVFAEASEAISHACALAHGDADHGHVAVVTTETDPQEFHCFVPAPGHTAAPDTALPPHLRLLASH